MESHSIVLSEEKFDLDSLVDIPVDSIVNWQTAFRPITQTDNENNGFIMNQNMSLQPSTSLVQMLHPNDNSNTPFRRSMITIPVIRDFKIVIYNLLVENYNGVSEFVHPITSVVNEEVMTGFQFNSKADPDKKMAEIYALHVRKADLTAENFDHLVIKDLYRFYKRNCIELLSKYFIKLNDYTYIYYSDPLFVPGEANPEIRIAKITSKKIQGKI